MSALAAKTGAIDLGQGFPDTDGPPEVLEAAIAAIRNGVNQYPPGQGFIELRLKNNAFFQKHLAYKPFTSSACGPVRVPDALLPDHIQISHVVIKLFSA